MGTCTQTHIATLREPVVFRLVNDVIVYAPGCTGKFALLFCSWVFRPVKLSPGWPRLCWCSIRLTNVLCSCGWLQFSNKSLVRVRLVGKNLDFDFYLVCNRLVNWLTDWVTNLTDFLWNIWKTLSLEQLITIRWIRCVLNMYVRIYSLREHCKNGQYWWVYVNADG